MSTPTLSHDAETGIWLRILYPEGELPAESARAMLGLTFPLKDKKRMRELSAKAQAGMLTPDEDQEMEVYERAGAMLSILKSKARQTLKTRRGIR